MLENMLMWLLGQISADFQRSLSNFCSFVKYRKKTDCYVWLWLPWNIIIHPPLAWSIESQKKQRECWMYCTKEDQGRECICYTTTVISNWPYLRVVHCDSVHRGYIYTKTVWNLLKKGWKRKGTKRGLKGVYAVLHLSKNGPKMVQKSS